MPEWKLGEYCDRCQNTGEVDCHCGGDLCMCGRDTYICPRCDGLGGAVYVPDMDDDEIERLRAINAELLAALELFVRQWNACGPNSDFGHHFANVLMASEAAIARARHETSLAGFAP